MNKNDTHLIFIDEDTDLALQCPPEAITVTVTPQPKGHWSYELSSGESSSPIQFDYVENGTGTCEFVLSTAAKGWSNLNASVVSTPIENPGHKQDQSIISALTGATLTIDCSLRGCEWGVILNATFNNIQYCSSDPTISIIKNQ